MAGLDDYLKDITSSSAFSDEQKILLRNLIKDLASEYGARVPVVTQAQAEAGTDPNLMWYSPFRIKQSITALGPAGNVRSDGTVPLTANWNAGPFKITASQLESNIVTGTAPLIVSSTTVVPNLNADLLDGNHGSAFALVTSGSWTPALSDGTTTATPLTIAGRWRRNGDVMHISGRMQTSSIAGLVGTIRITGLPMSALNVPNVPGHVVVTGTGTLNITPGQAVVGHIEPNTAYIRLRIWSLGTGLADMTPAEWSDDGIIVFSGSYFVA